MSSRPADSAVEIRRKLYELDLASSEDIVRDWLPFVQQNASAAVDSFVSKLSRHDVYQNLVNGYLAQTKDDLARHYALMFEHGFDDGYRHRLAAMVEAEASTGIGTRTRLAFATELFSFIVKAACKPSRMLTRDVGREITILMRYLLMDAFNAIERDYSTMRGVVDERQASLDTLIGALGTMTQAAVEGMSGTAMAIDGAAKSAAQALELGDDMMSQSLEAAQSAAAGISSTAAAAELLSRSIADIDSQSTRGLQAAQKSAASVTGARREIESLANAADQIGSFVTMISGIAGQTNLLALNATIEAARAGESGRGFAIVAQEVKSLASQTADATTAITAQIEAIQSAIARVVASIEDITATSTEAAEVSDAIAASVRRQTDVTGQIAGQAREIAERSQEVVEFARAVRASMNTSIDKAREVSGASEELDTRARELAARTDVLLTRVRQL